MRVGQVMTTVRKTIDTTVSVKQAAEAMCRWKVKILPVRARQLPAGILTLRDIEDCASRFEDLANTRVSQVMAPRVWSVFADQDVVEARQVMAKANVPHLLVLDHRQRIVGILSNGDLDDVGL